LHDERLLPKSASPTHVVTARRRHKKLFTADEARRLFSTTMRARDRTLRDLTADEAQLARYGLPVWHTEAALAAALELDVKALRHFSTHSPKDRITHYVTFAIPKRTGGERLIMAPKARLKRLQRKLNALLVNKLPVSEYAHGFRTARSVRSNAEPHVGKNVVLHLDIQDFFPSIHFGRVRGLLIALGYGYPVATTLAALMTDTPRQPVVVGDVCFFAPVGSRACPQGAPTSPGVSNALLMKMDHRLAGLARRYGFSYTRYADDLTFSGDDIDAAHALRLLAARVVKEEGFTINARKTRVLRSGSRQSVTGVVVNEVLGLSRQARRRLRAAIHQYGKALAAGSADPMLLARLDGKVAYVAMLNGAQARQLAPR
jgi:retron-type reverse transcriptase